MASQAAAVLAAAGSRQPRRFRDRARTTRRRPSPPTAPAWRRSWPRHRSSPSRALALRSRRRRPRLPRPPPPSRPGAPRATTATTSTTPTSPTPPPRAPPGSAAAARCCSSGARTSARAAAATPRPRAAPRRSAGPPRSSAALPRLRPRAGRPTPVGPTSAPPRPSRRAPAPASGPPTGTTAAVPSPTTTGMAAVCPPPSRRLPVLFFRSRFFLPLLPPPPSRILVPVPVAFVVGWWRQGSGGRLGSRGRLVRSRRFVLGSYCLGELSRPLSIFRHGRCVQMIRYGEYHPASSLHTVFPSFHHFFKIQVVFGVFSHASLEFRFDRITKHSINSCLFQTYP